MTIRYLISTLILLLPLLLSANTAKNKKLQSVSLQLQFYDQFQFAGYYIAKEKGFYEDVGLDVEIKKYQPDIVPYEEVLEGRADFGIGRSSIIVERSKGKELVPLAAILQSSPQILLTTAESNITKLSDLKGKRVMLTNNSFEGVTIESMLSSEGMRTTDFHAIEHDYNIQNLMDKKVDALSAYISNEPYILESLGFKPVIFNPRHYGFDFYEDILFTSEKQYESKSQYTASFLAASLKGWVYAFEHMDETVALILEKYNPQAKSKEALLYEANILKKLAYHGDVELGHIDEKKLEKIFDIYRVMGRIKSRVDFNEIIYKFKKHGLKIDKNEKKYLDDKKVIKMCVDPQWMPYESIYDGKHIGIAADMMQVLAKKLDTKIQHVYTHSWHESVEFAKKRKCDIFSLAMKTPSRQKYMKFTEPYLEFPLVVATTVDKVFVDNAKDFEGKKIAVMKDYAVGEILKNKYKKIVFIEVYSIQEALNMVYDKSVFGYVDALPAIRNAMDKYNYHDSLKVSGKLDETLSLSIGVRNDEPMLYDILSKGLHSIDELEKDTILTRWLSVVHKSDYSLVLKLLALFIVILTALMWAYTKLQNNKEKLEESLNNFEILLNSTRDIVVVISRDLRVLLVNKAGLDTFGYINKEITSIDIEDLVGQGNEKIMRLMHKFDTNVTFELDVYAKDGLAIPCLASGKNIIYNGKKARVFVLTNLTEEKKSQQKLIDMNASLEEKVLLEVENSRKKDQQILDQSRLAQMGEMVSMIAHQWRQPLGAIAATGIDMKLTMMMQKYNLEEKTQREAFDKYMDSNLNNIELYVQNLTETIDDFRNFYKPNREKEKLHIHKPFEKSLDILQGTLDAKGISMHVNFSSQKMLELHNNELMQVFINILKNAIDNFVEKDISNAHIDVESVDIHDGVRLAICDNGGGIPEAMQQKIFDPYFSTKSEKNGTGLGLYMSKTIVEEHHHGRLLVMNKDEGVCFIVELKE